MSLLAPQPKAAKRRANDPFAKAVMHIISKEYYQEKNVSSELLHWTEKCLREWEDLQQLKSLFGTSFEAERVIQDIAARFCSTTEAANEMSMRSYQKGQSVFFYGDRDEGVYFILKGSVELLIPKTSEELRSEIEFNRLVRQEKQQQQQQTLELATGSVMRGRDPAKFDVLVSAVHRIKGSHLDVVLQNEKLKKKYYDEANQVSKVKKVTRRKQKQSFGLLSVLFDKPRASTAVATEELFCVVFSASHYRRVLGEYFSFIHAKYIYLNKSLGNLSLRKETLFHLGVLFNSELVLNLSDYVFKEGEQCMFVYLLKRGRIEFQKRLVCRQSDERRIREQMSGRDSTGEDANEGSKKFKEVSLGLITEGELFGFEDMLVGKAAEMSNDQASNNSSSTNWFSQKPVQNRRSYSAKVISADATVIRVERAVFMKFLAANSGLDQDMRKKALVKINYNKKRIVILRNFQDNTLFGEKKADVSGQALQSLKSMLTFDVKEKTFGSPFEGSSENTTTTTTAAGSPLPIFMKSSQRRTKTETNVAFTDGNVEFLRFHDEQFADLKAMKQSYIEQGEKARLGKKISKPHSMVFDEDLMGIERVLSSTRNADVIKQYKESLKLRKQATATARESSSAQIDECSGNSISRVTTSRSLKLSLVIPSKSGLKSAQKQNSMSPLAIFPTEKTPSFNTGMSPSIVLVNREESTTVAGSSIMASKNMYASPRVTSIKSFSEVTDEESLMFMQTVQSTFQVEDDQISEQFTQNGQQQAEGNKQRTRGFASKHDRRVSGTFQSPLSGSLVKIDELVDSEKAEFIEDKSIEGSLSNSRVQLAGENTKKQVAKDMMSPLLRPSVSSSQQLKFKTDGEDMQVFGSPPGRSSKSSKSSRFIICSPPSLSSLEKKGSSIRVESSNGSSRQQKRGSMLYFNSTLTDKVNSVGNLLMNSESREFSAAKPLTSQRLSPAAQKMSPQAWPSPSSATMTAFKSVGKNSPQREFISIPLSAKKRDSIQKKMNKISIDFGPSKLARVITTASPQLSSRSNEGYSTSDFQQALQAKITKTPNNYFQQLYFSKRNSQNSLS